VLQRLAGQRAAGADAVLDDDVLQVAAPTELFRDDAAHDVGAATGREADQDAHEPLRQRGAGILPAQTGNHGGAPCTQQGSAVQAHGVPPDPDAAGHGDTDHDPAETDLPALFLLSRPSLS
jgi:hypothetical protein